MATTHWTSRAFLSHSYRTLPEAECVWESHAHTIELQYMIQGEEGICGLPTSALGEPLRRLADRDRLEWAASRMIGKLVVKMSAR